MFPTFHARLFHSEPWGWSSHYCTRGYQTVQHNCPFDVFVARTTLLILSSTHVVGPLKGHFAGPVTYQCADFLEKNRAGWLFFCVPKKKDVAKEGWGFKGVWSFKMIGLMNENSERKAQHTHIEHYFMLIIYVLIVLKTTFFMMLSFPGAHQINACLPIKTWSFGRSQDELSADLVQCLKDSEDRRCLWTFKSWYFVLCFFLFSEAVPYPQSWILHLL